MAEVKLLNKLRRDKNNRKCVDCAITSQFGFSNVCVPYKSFVCDICKSAHQSYSHRVKNTLMSTFTMDEVKTLQFEKGGGNLHCRAKWYANLTDEEYESMRPGENASLATVKKWINKVYEKEAFKGNRKQKISKKEKKKSKKIKNRIKDNQHDLLSFDGEDTSNTTDLFGSMEPNLFGSDPFNSPAPNAPSKTNITGFQAPMNNGLLSNSTSKIGFQTQSSTGDLLSGMSTTDSLGGNSHGVGMKNIMAAYQQTHQTNGMNSVNNSSSSAISNMNFMVNATQQMKRPQKWQRSRVSGAPDLSGIGNCATVSPQQQMQQKQQQMMMQRRNRNGNDMPDLSGIGGYQSGYSQNRVNNSYGFNAGNGNSCKPNGSMGMFPHNNAMKPMAPTPSGPLGRYAGPASTSRGSMGSINIGNTNGFHLGSNPRGLSSGGSSQRTSSGPFASMVVKPMKPLQPVSSGFNKIAKQSSFSGLDPFSTM